jgi:N-acylneuraminate cytidylyltransferase
MRPQDLASDASPELLSWKHALDSVPEACGPGGLFISLPATSPLRAPADVDNAVERFRAGGCDILFGITPARRNPWLNMVTAGADGLIRIVNSGSSAVRRQDVPEVFDITTCVYIADPAYIRACARIMEGRVGYVEIPAERSLDIDDPFDMHLAELLLTHPFKGLEGGT